MAIATLLQTVTASDDDCASLACVVSPTQVGSQLICFIATNETNNANYATGVTDTAGNTWTLVTRVQTAASASPGDVSLEVWQATNAGSVTRVTATWAVSESSTSMMFCEVSGVLGVDVSGTFTTTTSVLTESVSPGKFGDVFLFCAATGNSALPMSHTDTSTSQLAAAGYRYTAGTDTKASNMILTGQFASGAALVSPTAQFSTASATHMAGICVALSTQTATQSVGSGPSGLNSSWQLLWNGMSIGAGTSYGIAEVSGIREIPDMRTTDDDRSLQDGTFLAPDFMTGRTIAATVTIVGTSDADLATKVQTFENAFVPNTGSTAELPIYWQLPNGYQRRAFGRLRRRSAVVDFNYQFHAAQCAIQFYCSDPLTYDVFDTNATLSPSTAFAGRTYNRVFPFSYGSGVNSSTINAVNSGNVDTYPSIIFTGPSQNPYIINNTTGSYLWFNITMNQGDTFVVDTRNQTALLNGSSVRGNLIQGSTWMVLQPGLNNLQFTPGSGAGQCQVAFRSAWL